MCTVISENRPTLEISSPPHFWAKLLRKGVLFSQKVHPPIYATIHAVMFQKAPKKQQYARGVTNKWRQTPWQKRHCRIRNITTLKENDALFEEPLKFIAHGHIFKRFQQLCYGYLSMSSVYAFGLCTQLKTSLVIKFFLRRAKRMMFVLAVYYQYYVLWVLNLCVWIWSMYTVKDLFGNQMEGVSLEKSQTYDVCLGNVLPVFWYGRSYRCICSKFQLNGYLVIYNLIWVTM